MGPTKLSTSSSAHRWTGLSYLEGATLAVEFACPIIEQNSYAMDTRRAHL